MNQTLAELLQKKQEKVETAIDWDDRRDKYLAAVDELYRQIETILAEPIEQKTVQLYRRSKQLSESYIGTYAADDLILTVGDEQVRFSPRGRNVAGANGRVDVVGDRNEAILILQEDLTWGVVQARQPKLCVAPFDEATFTEVLQLVMRG